MLVTHGPPFGHGDLVVDGQARRVGDTRPIASASSRGCASTSSATSTRPAAASTACGGASLANVSHVDFDYRPVRPAVVFDLG